MAGVCTGPGPCVTTPFGMGDNWVTKVKGLPAYISAIAHALRRSGHSESDAIATAVATVKRWAAGGGNVTAETRARAAKAVAEWEAKKAAAHALSVRQGAAVDLAAPTHVYHWKHGWIPLTHEAALSKAHGSHLAASRILDQNGQHEDARRMLVRGLIKSPASDRKRLETYRRALSAHAAAHPLPLSGGGQHTAAAAPNASAKAAAAAQKRAALPAIGVWQPHQLQSDGTIQGDKATAKIRQSYRYGPHVVHIETPMTKEQTHGLLSDIHSVLQDSGQEHGQGVIFHVPSGDRMFASRKKTTGGYVRRGQRTIFINPNVANGKFEQQFGQSKQLMPAAHHAGGRRYVITHELGHVVDNQHGHTFSRTTLGSRQVAFDAPREDAQSLARRNRDGLSTYGRSNTAEAYAEAYAQWVHGGPGSSAVADAYAERFGWMIPKWYREGHRRAS